MPRPIISPQGNIYPLFKWPSRSSLFEQRPCNSFHSGVEFKAEFKTADPENWS